MNWHTATLGIAAALTLQACATKGPAFVIDTTPVSDENLIAWYAEALPLVEQQLDTELASVPMQILDKGEMYLAHQQMLESSIHPGFSDEARERWIKQAVETALERTIALYDPDEKRILIDRANITDHSERLTRRGHSTQNAAQLVLVHELVHAADDRRYDFNHLHEQSPWKSLERSAVFEGHAQAVTETICATLGCEAAFADDERYLGHLPPLHGSHRLFPNARGGNIALRYVQGARFIRGLHEREDGPEQVQRALRQAPADVLTLFDSERLLDPAIDASTHTLAARLAGERAQWLAKWIKVERASFTQSNFPRSSERRQRYVHERSERLLGSAMMSYYPPMSSDTLPVSIRLLQAKSAEAAESEARFMRNEVRRNTNGMLGLGVSLRQIKTWQETLQLDGEPATRYHFSAELVDTDNGERSPYRVTISQRGSVISEISSFKSEVAHAPMLDIAESMLVDPAQSPGAQALAPTGE